MSDKFLRYEIFHNYQFFIHTDVGKSSLLLRFTADKFGASATLGVDIKIKTIQINNQAVQLSIWDIAGSNALMWRQLSKDEIKYTYTILWFQVKNDLES